MAARSVRSIIDELDELQQKTALYQELQAFMGKHVKDDTTDIKMADGGFVSADAVNDLIAEFDTIVAEIAERTKKLERAEVKDGQGESGEETGKPRRKGR